MQKRKPGGRCSDAAVASSESLQSEPTIEKMTALAILDLDDPDVGIEIFLAGEARFDIGIGGGGGKRPARLTAVAFQATKEQAYSIAFNPEGNLLAIATVNNVYLFDPVSGEEVSRIPHKGIVYNVSFSPDGTRLATASQKVIQIWDVSNMQGWETDDIVEEACSRLIQNFSSSQWTALFGKDQPYDKLCIELPVPE
jgi:hypothetical protein